MYYTKGSIVVRVQGSQIAFFEEEKNLILETSIYVLIIDRKKFLNCNQATEYLLKNGYKFTAIPAQNKYFLGILEYVL